MLVIRLSRTGKKHSPHYRIVVQEKRSKLNGKAIDQVGHYHPADKIKSVVLDTEKITKWLEAGAQPSDTVTNILVKENILKAEHKVTRFYTAKPKEEAPEEKATTPAAEANTSDTEASTATDESTEEAVEEAPEVSSESETTEPETTETPAEEPAAE